MGLFSVDVVLPAAGVYSVHVNDGVTAVANATLTAIAATLSASNSIISCVATAQAGSSITCSVKGRDAANAVAGGISQANGFSVSFVDVGTGVATVVPVAFTSTGHYVASLASTRSGTFAVRALYTQTTLGVSLQSRVVVTAAPIDGAKSLLLLPAQGAAGLDVVVTVQARDAYGNPTGSAASNGAFIIGVFDCASHPVALPVVHDPFSSTPGTFKANYSAAAFGVITVEAYFQSIQFPPGANGTYVVGPLPPWVCGDGRRDQAEACDDGNAVAGDGCSSLCVVEAGWSCSRGVGADKCTPAVAPAMAPAAAGLSTVVTVIIVALVLIVLGAVLFKMFYKADASSKYMVPSAPREAADGAGSTKPVLPFTVAPEEKREPANTTRSSSSSSSSSSGETKGDESVPGVSALDSDIRTCLDGRAIDFLPGMATLTPQSVPLVEAMAQVLKERHRFADIGVHGHTACEPVHEVGDVCNLQPLSLMRAASVKKLLQANGFQGSVCIRGWGCLHPTIKV
jgi:cysteine-rich repeat protein